MTILIFIPNKFFGITTIHPSNFFQLIWGRDVGAVDLAVCFQYLIPSQHHQPLFDKVHVSKKPKGEAA